jgi:hypothetical protein
VAALIGRPRVRAGCVAALVVALIVALFSPALLGGDVLSNGDVIYSVAPWSQQRPAPVTHPSNPGIDDQTYEFNPDMLATRRALADGQRALWNPDQGAGRPLLASAQHAPLFPPQWLSLILPFWHSLVWVAALKLALAALGMYLLARFCGLRRGPAALSATAFAFSAYMISWLQSPIANSMAMCPWVMLTAGRVVRRPRPLEAVGLGVAVAALIFGGHPETIGFSLLASVLWAGWQLWTVRGERDTERALVRWRLGLMAGGVAIAIGLAAVLLIPFLELLRQAPGTSRAGGPYGYNIAWAFAFPELWGNPSKLIGDAGPINYTARTAYLGALPLLLAFAGSVVRRPRGAHAFWVVLTVLALLVAMPTPVHKLAGHLPGIDKTNLLSTIFLVPLGLALLAGFGLQLWLDSDGRVRKRMLALLAAGTLIPVAVLLRHTGPFAHLGSALGQLPSVHHDFVDGGLLEQIVAWRWLIFAGAGIAALLAVRRVPAQIVAVAAVLIVGVDLVTIDHGYQPAVPQSHVDPPTPPAIAYLQRHHGTQRISGAIGTTPTLLPDLAERYGLPDIQTYDFPKPVRFTDLWTGFGQAGGDLSWWDPTLPRAHEVLDVFAARYVLLPPSMPTPKWLEPVFGHNGETVAENRTALPRAWVAYSWRPAAGAHGALAQTLSSSSKALEEKPVLEGAGSPPGGTPLGASTGRVTVDQNEHVELRVDARAAGYVVLDDSYYPGWNATVDGHGAPILAANEDFRAVHVGPGRHLVSFTYRPASATVGALLSLATLAGLLLAVLAVAVRRRLASRSRS